MLWGVSGVGLEEARLRPQDVRSAILGCSECFPGSCVVPFARFSWVS